MIPAWQQSLGQVKREVIIRTFRDERIQVVLLGGSCVLSGVYLNHRQPNDIDLFFFTREDALSACRTISDWLVDGQNYTDPDRPNTYRASGLYNDESVEVHCVKLHPRWSIAELANRYLSSPKELDCVSIPILRYIGFELLRGLQNHDLQHSRAVNLFDLMRLFEAGITPNVIANEIRWMCSFQTPGIVITDLISDLPNEVLVDGNRIDLSGFAREFRSEILLAWNDTGLTELLSCVE